MSYKEQTPPPAKGKGILLDVGTNEVEFLEFSLGLQRFGVNVAKVLQILVWEDLSCTPLPDAQPGELGNVLYRGDMFMAYELSALLGLPKSESKGKKLLLLCHFNRRTSGFVVDAIHGIERVGWETFVPMGYEKLFKDAPNVTGSVKLKDRIMLILDLEAMMSAVDSSQSVDHYVDQIPDRGELDRSDVHVLYCEDSPTVRRIALGVLQKAGFTNIITMNNGLEGLNYLRSEAGKKVDILLSDIEMPQMDGLTLCKEVKGHPDTAHLPVIFFSSLISKDMKEKCDSVRGDACFSKPEVHTVAEAIDTFIRNR